MTQQTQAQDPQSILTGIDEFWRQFIGEIKSVPPELLDKPAAHPDEGEYTIRDVLTGPLIRHPRMHLEYVQKVRRLLEAKK